MGRTLNSLSIGAAALVLATLPVPRASAQSQGLVVRDGTLGTGDLEVGPGTDPLGGAATYLITPELGEQSGSNLFHSFASFGVGTGETATFTGPDPIEGPQSVDNVISRVTGGDESQIDGTLRSTIPGADLWLLNPSGVVFGEGAQLDVPGSFHASTGDYLGFGAEGLERFYGDPSRPSVLSTAPPAAFGFLGEGPAAAISVTGATLATVRAGDGLELTGGDVTLTRATLDAPGGAISIRGGHIVVAEGSRVLAENAGESPAGTIDVAASQSVLVDDSLLSVSTHSAGDAGTIRIDSPAVTFQNGPDIVDDRKPTEVGASAETSSSGAGGVIEIDAGTLVVTDGGSVTARTFGLDATGRAGTIRISADSLYLSARSVISAEAFASQGDAGAIKIEAGSVQVDGAIGYAVILASVFNGDIANPNLTVPGAPGRIDIRAGSIELVNGGEIENGCFGCTSKAADRPADAATVRIVADQLILRGSNENGSSYVSSSTWRGPGDAGTIQVRADSILISTAGPWNPGIYTATDFGSTGNAGAIAIEANSLVIERGGSINAGSFASGDAGSITLDADSVVITEQGLIHAGTAGEGAGGTITIDAGSVVITEQGVIFASTSGEGAGGSITIDARTLLIERDGIITAGVSGRGTGAAGTVDVTASESILVTGAGDTRFSLAEIVVLLDFGGRPLITGIFSANGSGSITLEAPEITLTDGAIVMASTGLGDAGDVLLSGDRIYVLNGALVDSTSYVREGRIGGNVGNITLEATELIEVSGSRAGVHRGKPFEDVSRVTSANFSEGEGGTVTLAAPRILIDGGAVATTALPSSSGREGVSGGNITVSAGELIVRGGGRIDASSFIAGPGGNIEVTASDSIVVEGKSSDGIASGISSRTGADGLGGEVLLHAPLIELSEGGEISAKSEADPGLEGEVGRIFDSLRDDRFWIGRVPTEATGDAGSVRIEAKDLVHLDAGTITASVNGGPESTGGNIFIDPEVVILQNGSRIVAQAGQGSGGRIEINADNYFAFPGSVVSASAGDPELSGTVEVNTPDVDLAGTLTALPASYLDASSLMRERCAARRSGERAGSFAVRGNGGIPAEPDGWLPASVATELERGLAPTTERPSTSASAPRLALLGTCQ